jgi:hypothetical protein
MAGIRLQLLFALLLPALPACAVTKFFSPEPAKLPPVPPPNVSEFTALAPGQRVTKAEVVAQSQRPPAADPATESIVPAPPVPASATEPNPLPYGGSFLDPRDRAPRPDGPLVAALRAHLDNQFAAAVGHLSTFERPNQELLLLLLPLIDTARTTDLTGRDPRAAAALAKQLDTVVDLVNKSAPLEIRTTAFVHKVVQYGVYHPLPANHKFLPGGIGLLYAEIDRVPSEPAVMASGEAGHVSRLSGSLQLKDAMGRVVELYDIEKGKMVAELPFVRADFTRSPVRDFFLKIEFPVPEKAGRYSLTLEIRDPNPQSTRRVRKTVEFLAE